MIGDDHGVEKREEARRKTPLREAARGFDDVHDVVETVTLRSAGHRRVELETIASRCASI